MVLAGCLGSGDDLAELGIVVEPGVDVTSDEAITGLAKRLEQRGTRLEWLVNVAGIMGLDTLDTVDYEDVPANSRSMPLGRCASCANCAACSTRGPRWAS